MQIVNCAKFYVFKCTQFKIDKQLFKFMHIGTFINQFIKSVYLSIYVYTYVFTEPVKCR